MWNGNKHANVAPVRITNSLCSGEASRSSCDFRNVKFRAFHRRKHGRPELFWKGKWNSGPFQSKCACGEGVGGQGETMPRKRKPDSPLRYFNSSPEVIRLVVMMYVRFPLSLRNVEDLLSVRGIDICHETVRLWWNRFGPLFAGDIRRQRISRMRGFRQRRWHLDEMYVTRRAAKSTWVARWSTCGVQSTRKARSSRAT